MGALFPGFSIAGEKQFSATAGPGTVYLRSPVKVELKKGNMLAEFEVKKGKTIPFVLTYASSFEAAPEKVNPRLALKETETFWKKWARRGSYKGEWKSQVERSLLTLKALTYRPTGGIVAAPTTSLPEQIGGDS